MFDFDAGKLVIIGIVALVVIGPKDLPRVMRQVGQAVGKMRRLAADFQAQFMDAMREADVADIKADVAKLADSAKLDIDFNPVRDVRNHFENAVEGPAAPIAAEPAAGVEAPAHIAASDAAPDLHLPAAVHEPSAPASPAEHHDAPAPAPHGA